MGGLCVENAREKSRTQDLEKWSRVGKGSGDTGGFVSNRGSWISNSSRRDRCNARRCGQDSEHKTGPCIYSARTNDSGGMKRATSKDTTLRCRDGLCCVGRLRRGPHHREAPRLHEMREADGCMATSARSVDIHTYEVIRAVPGYGTSALKVEVEVEVEVERGDIGLVQHIAW